MRAILGINFWHDSSAALMVDGELKAAVEQERLDRHKHSGAFPRAAMETCLDLAGIRRDQVTDVVCGWHPKLNMSKRIMSPFHNTRKLSKVPEVIYRHTVLESFGLESRIGRQINEVTPKARIHWIEHHMSHASSAFLVSQFEDAAIWSVDGRGEWSTSLAAKANLNIISPFKRTYWPNSIGYYYTMFTYYLGFPGFDNEFKVMGLAGYGTPRYKEQIAPLLRYSPEKLFRFDTAYFNHPFFGDPYSQRFGGKLAELLGPPREPGSDVTERYQDIAASVQSVLNDVAVKIAQQLKDTTGSQNLCLAGGVALNGVMNNAIRETGLFQNIFIQPASGDAGCALGNVSWCENVYYEKPRRFTLDHVYLGRGFSDEQIREELDKCLLDYRKLQDPAAETAKLLAEGNIIGWFQGRSEFGPRALGDRSILADPRQPEAKDIVNAKIKFREEFRPFAPSVMVEHVGEYFDVAADAKYMLLVCQVRPDKKAQIPAVTHVDGTARVQTVSEEDNPLYWRLISEFKNVTGVPVILNTSFNVKDEPIVDSPVDAIRCFFSTGLDCLVMGPYLISKRP